MVASKAIVFEIQKPTVNLVSLEKVPTLDYSIKYQNAFCNNTESLKSYGGRGRAIIVTGDHVVVQGFQSICGHTIC